MALCRRCSEPRWLCVRGDDRRSLDDFPKKGPEFLWKPEEGWPQDPSSPVTISEGDPEVKLDGKVSWHWYLSLFTLWLGTFTEHLPGIDWKRQLRGCYGTAKTCEDLQSVWNQWSRLKPSPSALSLITIDEIECAELEILKSVQKFHFQEELESLNKSEDKRYVKKSSSLRSLDPILMNDLLRVGGRLSLVSTTFGAKHQIILPKNDHVTNLIVEHYHLLSEHSGREFVLSLAREKFWIIQTSSVIRRVLSKCVDCQCR